MHETLIQWKSAEDKVNEIIVPKLIGMVEELFGGISFTVSDDVLQSSIEMNGIRSRIMEMMRLELKALNNRHLERLSDA